MQEYEGEQIQFNLLSLCRSPLLSYRRDLAANIHSLNTVESNLSPVQPDWQQFAEHQDVNTILRGPDTLCGVTKEMLDIVQSNQKYLKEPEELALTATTLIETRLQLMGVQGRMRKAILDEEAVIEEDNERARSRRHDYTPMISLWTRLLVKDGLLRQLFQEQL